MNEAEEYYKTTVEINKAHAERFKELFPQQGALKWFFGKCLENFVNIHETDLTDQEIRSSVIQAVEDMEDATE